MTLYLTRIKKGNLELISQDPENIPQREENGEYENQTNEYNEILKIPYDFILQTAKQIIYICLRINYKIIEKPNCSIGRIIRT